MSLRCFIALDIDVSMRCACEAARKSLSGLDERLRGEKWVAPQNLHVTLAFIGDIDADRTDDLIGELAPVFDEAEQIMLSRPHICARPSDAHATMIWIALDDPTGRFGAVAADLDRVCARHACRDITNERSRPPQKRRKSAPHLTLCRLRRTRRLETAAITASQQVFLGLEEPMSYPRATLYSSRLAPQGPTYSELFVWHMRGE